MKKSILNRLTLERQNAETLSYARFRIFSLNGPKIKAMVNPEVLRFLETTTPRQNLRDLEI